MPENNESKGFLGRLMSMSNDSIPKTIFMTVLVCLVCAVVVASAAVSLKEKQEINKLIDKRQNILQVAGLDDDSISVEDRFLKIDSKVVDLSTGEYVEDIDVEAYDQRLASKDPEQSRKLPKKQDIASIGRQAKYAKVYLVKNDQDQVNKIVLPVHGYGLWSTLYGFVSVEMDASTIYRLKFYDHAETPGLGGEVDNPNWRSIWTGKQLYDEAGDYQFNIIKGAVVANNPKANHQVDGLAGATLTSRGVDNLFKYWLSKDGFGSYLDKIRTNEGEG